MMDSVFMQSTPRSTVMEFFPKGTYARDQETVVQSIGLKYMAWWDKEYDFFYSFFFFGVSAYFFFFFTKKI